MELPKDFNRSVTVGEYTFDLPEPPKNQKDIYGWNTKNDLDQRWERPKDILGEKAFNGLEEDAQVKYLTREFKRRREGFWFYNKGKIEYVTGHHYFFLTYWRIPEGFAYFKKSDQRFFWLFDYSCSLEWCYGLLQLTQRRDGKTARACCILFNITTLNSENIAGIQSKTNGDSKKIFKKITSSWKKLESYMKPVDSGDTDPQKDLRFEEPGKRTTKGGSKTYKHVLNSSINYAPSTETSYDGDRLTFYYDDEIGKTLEADVYNRWLIVKECLTVGKRVVGKSLHTSTVEEMEKAGGENCFKMWCESDLAEAKKLGRKGTQLGLLRYFKPATEGLEGFVDEYGHDVIDNPTEEVYDLDGELITQGSLPFIKEKRIGLSRHALASDKRKYPLTVDEAFYMDGKDSSFDVVRLNEQIDYNNTFPDSYIVKGNFIWDDMAQTKVRFVQTTAGRFDVLWMPKTDKRNLTQNFKGLEKPSNCFWLSGGVDPYDHKYTTGNKKSNGAFYVYKKMNFEDSEFSKSFVCQYVDRPANPEDFWDDILKACVFYGCEVLAETNKIGLVNHFRMKGKSHYLMDRPAITHVKFSKTRQKEKGLPMNSVEVRQALMELMEIYIVENVGYDQETDTHGTMYFNELCKCLIRFKPDKWTDYDEFVGAVLALVASTRYNIKDIESSKTNLTISDTVRRYRN